MISGSNSIFSTSIRIGIIRSTLEGLGSYELVLDKHQFKLLSGLANALKPFNDFTKLIQGVDYPTINLIPLLITEIEHQLNEQRMFEEESLIVDAIDILSKNLQKRIEMNDIVITAACLDPAVQHLPIIDEWLQKKSK